jgi:hypothetical protein
MSVPSVTKTWLYNVNNVHSGTSVLDSYQLLWFNIVNKFLSGGWTVPASCRYNSGSGTFTAGLGNLWASKDNLAWSGGINRSWIILQHPINNYQLAIQCDAFDTPINFYPFNISIYTSRNGYNTASLSTNSIPSPLVAGDSFLILSSASPTTGIAWGTSAQRFVHHYMYSTDGYCHRHVIYCQDFPVLALFCDIPEDPSSGWAPGLPAPGYTMVLSRTGITTPGNALTYAAVNQAACVRSRIGTNGSTAINVSAWLSVESYAIGNSVALSVANDFTNEYPMAETGIISDTSGMRGRFGKPFDLWYGIDNMQGSIAYPDDSSRQFAQHGVLITPWNGTGMMTR